MEVVPLTVTLSNLLAKLLLPIPVTLLCKLRGLGSNRRNAYIRRDSNDSTELKVKPASWSLHSRYSESAGKVESYCTDRS